MNHKDLTVLQCIYISKHLVVHNVDIELHLSVYQKENSVALRGCCLVSSTSRSTALDGFSL